MGRVRGDVEVKVKGFFKKPSNNSCSINFKNEIHVVEFVTWLADVPLQTMVRIKVCLERPPGGSCRVITWFPHANNVVNKATVKKRLVEYRGTRSSS